MLTTEAEAKEKWCPHVRGARIEPLGHLRPDLVGVVAVVGGCNADTIGGVRVPASCRCIASACMQWRWHDVTKGAKRRGYCGLAGDL